MLQTVWHAGRRRLPERYERDLWDRRLRRRVAALVWEGCVVLDIGAGRRPIVPRGDRPSGIHYVALDPAADELARAPADAYDEVVVAAAEDRVPALDETFDLAVSFLALEHVRSTERVFDNVYAYLKPGGTLLAVAAGARSPFALANRALPPLVTRRLLAATQGRPPASVFRGRYDSCTHDGLLAALGGRWTERSVEPMYTGAGYVLFSRALTALYVGYEEWLFRAERRGLAPYYLIEATK
ncbi:MAG TPA: class I SAM-dependent methyltransferase [Candidatus Binatia bacterium]|nr:class I SAM-dependent methyltransferase [Candidatus Binatia bacterium]